MSLWKWACSSGILKDFLDSSNHISIRTDQELECQSLSQPNYQEQWQRRRWQLYLGQGLGVPDTFGFVVAGSDKTGTFSRSLAF